jgi:casein kinase 1
MGSLTGCFSMAGRVGKLAAYVFPLTHFTQISTLPAQSSNHLSHAHANTPHTPHRDRDREHRREREHGAHRRSSRQLHDNNTPSTPHVLSPSPAHVKGSSRRHQERDRGASGRDVSVQALAPTTRRASQQQQTTTGGLSAPHPYATAPSTPGYRTTPGSPYERQSPVPQGTNALANGSVTALNQRDNNNLNGSESFLYGGQPGKNGTTSREGTANGGTVNNKQYAGHGGMKGMKLYDRDQRHRMGGQNGDVHGGRRGGIFSVLCCRG